MGSLNHGKNDPFRHKVLNRAFTKFNCNIKFWKGPATAVMGQCWWRHIAKSKELRNAYKDKDSECGKWLRKFFGLSYLPASIVPDAFIELLLAAPLSHNDAPLHPEFMGFATYISDYYINSSTFPPDMWAYAPAPKNIATTNACESYHSQLQSEFYATHPPLFEVIRVVKEQQALHSFKMDAAAKGRPPVRKKDVV